MWLKLIHLGRIWYKLNSRFVDSPDTYLRVNQPVKFVSQITKYWIRDKHNKSVPQKKAVLG
jgi:hypothetical protein